MAKKAAPKKATGKAALVEALKAREAALEKKGGPKSKQETALEKEISKLTGKPYKGKR